jgi:DNA-binding response OmpR family regulator
VNVLLVTPDPNAETVVPALSLLRHTMRSTPRDMSSTMTAVNADVALVDARSQLTSARGVCRRLATATSVPVVAVVNESDLIAINGEWKVDDILIPGAGPAQLEARLRLLVGRTAADAHADPEARLRDLVINEQSFTAHLQGRPLNSPTSHPHRVRLTQVPGAPSRPCFHPPTPTAGSVGIRVLRRQPHR